MEKLKEVFMFFIGTIVVLGALGSTILLTFHAVPDDNRDVLNQANGSLWTMAIMVITWCFGSTKGSSDKDKMLANMQRVPDSQVTISKTENKAEVAT